MNLVFPHPLPATGCIGLYYGGGTVFAGNATLTSDLDLTYQPASSFNPNKIVNVGGGEYCFGADWGCQNATVIDGEAFALPTTLPAGHLLQIYGNISDSSFDGTTTCALAVLAPRFGDGRDWACVLIAVASAGRPVLRCVDLPLR